MGGLVQFIGELPGYVLFVLTLAYVFLAVVVGTRLSKRRAGSTKSAEIGSAVGATLGLLAFMLAFTFNMAANRFDARKQLFIDDVNAIETAYLRAQLLPQADSAQAQELLREYVDLRVALIADQIVVTEAIERSSAIHDRLWKMTADIVTRDGPSIILSLFAQSVNQLIDMQTRRVTVGLYFTIPATIWMGLYGIAGLGMVAVGYQFGQAERGRMIVTSVLALSFSAVILLIADLDRAGQGTVRVDQRPMMELQARLNRPGDGS